MKTVSRNTGLRRMFALFTALMLVMVTMMTPAFAESADTSTDANASSNAEAGNEAESDARSGVMYIEYGYAKDKQFEPIIGGSAFLINADTMLTCSHVVHVYGKKWRNELEKEYGKDWEKHMAIQVFLANGSPITATESLNNSKVDFAILKLDRTINQHKALPLRKEPVKTQEKVTAMGFPYSVDVATDGTAAKYTFEYVNTPGGQITTPDSMVNSMHYIQHDATVRAGNSGGPLLDTEGNVVGINSAVTKDNAYSYAIAIKEVLYTLDQLGTEYTPAGDISPEPEPDPKPNPEPQPEPEPEVEVDTTALQTAISNAQSKDEKAYTAESWAGMQAALNTANSAMNSEDQATIDSAATELNNAIGNLEEAKSGVNPILIAGIVAALIVIILIVVLVILMTKKKKPDDKQDFTGFTPPPTAPTPTPVGAIPGKTTVEGGGFDTAPVQKVDYVAPSFEPEVGATGVLDSGSSETSVLFGGSGETTVLSGKPYATLIRKSNNEQITASAANFVIGKERRRVDYCIENSSVSRNHAKLINNNGKVSIIDLGSTNGTFVNGVKCAPNVSVDLKDGDKLVLADEEFEIKLL